MSYHQDFSWNAVFPNDMHSIPGVQRKSHENLTSNIKLSSTNGIMRVPLSEWNYSATIENRSHRIEEKAAFRSNGKDCFLHSAYNGTNANNQDQALQDTVTSFDPYAIFSHFEHLTFSEPQVSIEVVYNYCRSERPVLIAPIPSYARTTQYPPKQSSVEPIEDIQSLPSKDLATETSFHHCAQPLKVAIEGGNICSHCKTESTSLWRRLEGMLMCNACALYFKLHGINRPLYLNTGVVKRRNRLGTSANKRQRRYRC
jgi:hypothetical protein